jgi:hypothetical protein
MSLGCRRVNRRAALLVEVVVSLTIMVAALGVMGAQLVAGLRMTALADQQIRAAHLADRLLALLELDLDTAQSFFDERETEGDFGEQHRGYFWRATIEPLEVDLEGIGLVTIDILYQEDPQLRDTIDGARVIRRLKLLKAEPGLIDLAEDFGLDEEQLAQISELLPIAGLDPSAMNPQQLVSLDPELLLELLPQLLPLLEQFISATRGGRGGGGGGDPQANLEELIRNRLGDQAENLPLEEMIQGMGGGGFPGGGGRGGRGGGQGAPGGRGGAGGQADTEGGPSQPFTIEDLQRRRDEANAERGGRR